MEKKEKNRKKGFEKNPDLDNSREVSGKLKRRPKIQQDNKVKYNHKSAWLDDDDDETELNLFDTDDDTDDEA
ncbi:MAG: hypothetical protein KA010_03575 [Saprospiraceae bacterium]|nr:hypothetical protein [Saprospiraceae bacterium]